MSGTRATRPSPRRTARTKRKKTKRKRKKTDLQRPAASAAAGRCIWQASAGFLITGVGLLQLSSRVGRAYGLFFTCVLYLTIGPFFAIPRCATVSFTVGIQRLIPAERQPLVLAAFSLAFFAAVLVLRALAAPMGDAAAVEPAGNYAAAPFATGLLEGYNTMDALAGLAFGIIVVQAIRRLGVEEPGQVARNTVLAGLLSSLLMAVIYLLVTVVGAQSRGQFAAAANGGEALARIAAWYFGGAGAVILAVTVTVACLKTAVGLITSCGETFVAIFPGGPSYRVWAAAICVLSFLLANLGLDAILDYSLPLQPLIDAAVRWLPLYAQGFGWVCPALAGLAAGLAVRRLRPRS